ncbi:MAG: hypothetical protein M3253_05705 [Chloroflexota bacterium]|nr:hypothetical protein [Chloroflexota bacterium]
MAGQFVSPAPRASANAAPLKAVIIAGPTGGLTAQNLADSEKMAQAAEAQGMDVRRIYHPRATAERVLKNIQGANLVVYMGHGNGWPSPYGPFQERTKNGFGLNPYEGAPASKHTYLGGNTIRSDIRLAPNAVVLLVHLCYASGNGEPGMAIPREDVARQRVDNYAAAFLAVGARAVFATSLYQRLDLVTALNSSNRSMDELFMTRAAGGSNGFIGWRNKRFASERTRGAANHLDPHSSGGYQRALSGDLSMTAAEWRGGASRSESDSRLLMDGTPPSVPHGLRAESLGYRRIALSWKPSTDDRAGTIRYRVFRNGVRIATVTTTSFVDRPATVGWYTYKLRAVDAAGNRSAFSPKISGRAVRGSL